MEVKNRKGVAGPAAHAGRARSIRMCSLDARSWSQPGHSLTLRNAKDDGLTSIRQDERMRKGQRCIHECCKHLRVLQRDNEASLDITQE